MQRQLQHRPSAPAWRVREGQRAAVPAGDLAGDREAEAASTAPAIAVEGLEEMLPGVGREARAGVRDGYPGRGGPARSA